MRAILLCVIGGCLACTSFAFDTSGADDITAVSGRTSKDYVRVRQPNGSFASESYVFAKGGVWSGAMKDATIDKMSFLEIAHMIAYPLESQSYIPSKDPRTTKLLIMVYWGTTHAPEHASQSEAYDNLQIAEGVVDSVRSLSPHGAVGTASTPYTPGSPQEDELTTAIAAVAADNRIRETDDIVNVKMLGYDSWWEQTQGDHRGTAFEQERQDLINEIEENRYFVVLMAYDFQQLWKEKKNKLLWETRFSIRQRHHEFDKDLPAMAQFASQYFGQDSDGLVHEAIPLGHVEIGEVKSLGEVPEKSNSDTGQTQPKP